MKQNLYYYPSQDPMIKLERELKIRGFSKETIKVYLYYNIKFLDFTNKSPKNICNEDIKKYLEYLVDKNVSKSTLSLVINSLKFYYKNILKRRFFYDIKHPKKESKLPVVLSRREIKDILSSISNRKHKLILALIYASGLRISEVVKLRIKDIDFNRGLIIIKQSKGNKDRQTILPIKLIKHLKELIDGDDFNKYVFKNNRENKLSTRTIQKIFENALKNAKIKKSATCHSLRHSFATHLLEKGTNIRYIQELLGHKRLETTQIYTKVINQKLKEIRSPLDNL